MHHRPNMLVLYNVHSYSILGLWYALLLFSIVGIVLKVFDCHIETSSKLEQAVELLSLIKMGKLSILFLFKK